MDYKPHLLIVDDDREIRSLLARFLGQHGFRLSVAENGAAMRKVMQAAHLDLVVLDVMMPGEDGLSLCRTLRTEAQIPIIMLTAMGEETDRIVGLELGADDYLAKPFNPRELLARIKAVLRRTRGGGEGGRAPATRQKRFEGWRLDTVRRELHAPTGALVQLTGGEFDLLAAFVERPQRILTRDQLLDLTRGRAAVAFDRSIDVQVSRLRRKIEVNAADPQLIKTVRTGGYIFPPPVIEE